MSGTSPGSNAPNLRPLRMVRLRTAVIAAVVSLLIGVGIGAAGRSPDAAPTPAPSGVAASSQQLTSPQSALVSESTTPPTPEPTTAPTPEPTAIAVKPVTVKGAGSQKTKPFDMPDGDFTVIVTGSADGNVILSLIPRGETSGETLVNEIAHGRYKYETVVYGVSSGSYYLDALVDGSWVVTFTPLP